MKPIIGYEDTRTNNEDLALTPYVSFVRALGKNKQQVYGLGLTWIHSSLFLGFGLNLPKDYPFFVKHTLKTKTIQDWITLKEMKEDKGFYSDLYKRYNKKRPRDLSDKDLCAWLNENFEMKNHAIVQKQ